MATSGDFSVTNNSSVETDGTQTLETSLSHNTIREGMAQFTRQILQASATEDGSQNEQQLLGYSALEKEKSFLQPEKSSQGKENILRRMIVKVKTQIKSMRILNVFESCLKMRNFSRIYQIIWPNMLMSNFLCILQKRCYRRVL